MMENNNDKKQLKNQIKYIMTTNLLIVVTIAITIYEMYNNLKHYYSYITMGLVFIMMSINQYIHYRRSKSMKNIILLVLYAIIGAVIIGYRLLMS